MVVSLLEKIKAELAKYADSPHGSVPNVKTFNFNAGDYNLLILKTNNVTMTTQIRKFNIFKDANRTQAIGFELEWEPKYTGILLLNVPQDTYYHLLTESKQGIAFNWNTPINGTASSTGKNIHAAAKDVICVASVTA